MLGNRSLIRRLGNAIERAIERPRPILRIIRGRIKAIIEDRE